ncbi:MAG: hypothetical protein RL219_2538 [Actinomycetota bacterium]|jgi:glycerophosphoryl diester phosphodiesterase
MQNFRFLEHIGPIPFAHRGGASEAPENTMPAFELAVSLGYRYLETDVQVTADGVLVAFHDNDLERTTGRKARVSNLPWADVRTALVDGREPIPLLEDLLGAFPEARINIDCKTDAAVDALVETIGRTGAIDRVCIGAFSASRLRRIRERMGTSLCTSLGPSEVARWLTASTTGRRSMMPQVPCAQVPVTQSGLPIVTERTVAFAHSCGMQVHVWTIDDPDEMHRLLDLGVDGLMTDRPATLKSVLSDRGQWGTARPD